MSRFVRLAAIAALSAVQPVAAEELCITLKAELTPTDSLQMVAWLERTDGTFVDTLYITAKTGSYGLGNRPGRFDFNSGPIPDPSKGIDDMWPYGRRVNVFPVWAHRHGKSWPEIVFQDGAEDNLSHSTDQSSAESNPPYCRPLSSDGNQQCWDETDKQIWDTGTCATTVYTDKGTFSPTKLSLYPPRSDLTRQKEDAESVAMFRLMNPFDAVSRATPVGGQPLAINWSVPEGFPQGDYVLHVEASKAFDFNATYNETTLPPPMVRYSSCGKPYRGQPSVVYRVPVTISATQDIQLTETYAGYGHVDGADGTLNPPDATITTDTPGSGALRLQLVSDGGSMFRLRVSNLPQIDYADPDAPTALEAIVINPTSATLQFVEPGDDGQLGPVGSYEIRIRANEPITDENFASSATVIATVIPGGPGQLASVDVEGLLPETDYYVAIRAHDDCRNHSPITVAAFTTGERIAGAVDWCFVATAAYGSAMADDVIDLRRFRDTFLSRTVFGELAIETYYTFGPALAGLIGESDVLRHTARAALAPVIDRVRGLTL